MHQYLTQISHSLSKFLSLSTQPMEPNKIKASLHDSSQYSSHPPFFKLNSFCFNKSLSNSQTQAPLQIYSPKTTSCHSNGSILEVTEELQENIIEERKVRRMISNRESARRSRMRKKKQIEELQYMVNQLENSNRQLSEKLIQLLECNQQILQENSELKEKVSSLQIVLADLLTPLRNIHEDGLSSMNRHKALPSSSSH